jgi:predicted  nucleic acid-binding Zn-ribbon protein
MDGASDMAAGALGGGLGLWFIQRMLNRLLDRSDRAELLGPELRAIRDDLQELKDTLKGIGQSVHGHATDIERLRDRADRIETQEKEAHVAIWKRADEMNGRIGALELAQASKRGRGR